MITDAEKAIIAQSWKLVEPIAETVPDLFYRRLFEIKPEYRSLFPENMERQKGKLLRMLAFVVKSLDFPDSAWQKPVSADEDLFLVILALGRRHSELYNVPDEAYASVGEALLWTLDYGLGKSFTPEVRAAWQHIYDLLAMTMKMGQAALDPASPAHRSSVQN